MTDPAAPTFDDIVAASIRIAPFIHRTPVLRGASIDEQVGSRVHLKAEHLQRGAFKFRSATNAVQRLDAARAFCGVAAHSSGNHASALALAASMRGIPTIMRTSSRVRGRPRSNCSTVSRRSVR